MPSKILSTGHCISLRLYETMLGIGALLAIAGCEKPTVHSGSADGGDPPGSYVSGADGGQVTHDDQGVAPTHSPPGDAGAIEAGAMVDVPEGSFQMGCNPDVEPECRDDEKPRHEVLLPAFSIDKTEVTQLQYFACTQAGACTYPKCEWDPSTVGDHPIACVNRDQAIAYCKFVGKRLPTEAEWEKAARGSDGRKFPWGNDAADCAHVNMFGCKTSTVPVGSLPNASPYGAFDLAGNVVEWTQDVYSEVYYASSPHDRPTGPAEGIHFSGRGGGFRSDPIWQRCGSRDKYQPEYVRDSMGIRCAK